MPELQPNYFNKLAVPLIRPEEQLKGAEFTDLRRWLKEQVMKLPEMKVNKTSLTDNKSWKANLTPDQRVDSVTSPFFSLEGVQVDSQPLSWHQGAVIQRSEFLPTKSGEKTEVSGVVIMLTNPKNETLITLSQEPLTAAQYRDSQGRLHGKKTPDSDEVHPVIRSSIQTSVQKLQLISRNVALGNQYDKPLTALLTKIAEDRHTTVTDILNATEFSKAPTDGNRISGNVVYGTIAVSDTLANQLSEAVPGSRWCPQRELDALVVAGLTNGHLNVGRSVTEAQQRLRR